MPPLHFLLPCICAFAHARRASLVACRGVKAWSGANGTSYEVCTLQAERFKEQELWVLTAVQAMAAIPGITLSVVNFRPFMDRHVRNAAHGARYESLAPISAPK